VTLDRIIVGLTPHRRARGLGWRRSVLRYSELPSSGRSCRITAQGEGELSDSDMPNFNFSRSVSGLSWAQNESSDRTRSKGAATLARCPEHRSRRADGPGHFFLNST
jgi:hypothetical protein